MTVTVPMGSTERDALGKKRLERGVHGGVVIYEIATVYWLKTQTYETDTAKTQT